MKQFRDVNLPTNKQIAFFENASGGFERNGCTKTDFRNYERNLREDRGGHDAHMLINYFKWLQEKNPCEKMRCCGKR